MVTIPMKIDYINGPKTDKIYGMSKYQMEITKRLDTVQWNVIEYDSLLQRADSRYNALFPWKASPSQVSKRPDDVKPSGTCANKLSNVLVEATKKSLNKIDRYQYQRLVRKKITKGNIKHITSQELAYLLKFIDMENSIVTCYDLIIWVYDKNHSSLWKDNIEGLKRADTIVTISDFSKNDIINYLDYPEDQIKIVYPAVNHESYYKNRDKNILKRWNISPQNKVVLYVGSETPRQNVPLLIKAFAELKKQMPEVKLLKIGEPQSYSAREKNLQLVGNLNLQEDIIFAGYIKEDDIPKCYNAADLLMYPCSYAGFGLPPLEAMACGTPVITSDTSSLPEVVGDAGIMIDPNNVDLMAEKMYEVLNDDQLNNKLIKTGLKRSKMFNWDRSAAETLDIYNDIYNGD